MHSKHRPLDIPFSMLQCRDTHRLARGCKEEAEAKVDKGLNEVLKDKLPPSVEKLEEGLPALPVAEEKGKD